MRTLFLHHYYLFLIVYFVAVTATLLIEAYVLRRMSTKKSRTRTFVVGFSVSVFFTLYLLIALECIFAYLFVKSDGFGFTLASQRWFNRYWNPINSYGYRDYEPKWTDKIVFVVGDSFVAGHGIEKINDRFSNLLSNKLGNSWSVTTLAQNGWALNNYIEALVNHNQEPNLIIISYFINDIESAVSKCGIKSPQQLTNYPNKLVRPLVDSTYLFNWVYWRWLRAGLGSNTNTYWKYLKEAYDNDDVWKSHLQELDTLVEYANKVESRIIFIIWPNLKDIIGSKDITDKVFLYLKNKGVKAFDLSEHFKKRDSKELIVNSMDGHPSHAVNAEVAQLLYEALSPWN